MILKRLLRSGIAFLFLIGLFLFPLRTAAADAYVFDETGRFTADQLLELDDLAAEISERQECGVYVVITDGLHGYREQDFAEGIFRNYDLGYGIKDSPSGVVLAIDYTDSFFDTYSYGAAEETFTTARLDELNDLVYDYLAQGNWYGACEGFLKRCDELLTSSGYYYHTIQYSDPAINQHIVETSPEQRRDTFFSRLPFAAVGSAAVGGLSVLVMRGKHKRTGLATHADPYIVKNGVRLIDSQDLFINRTRTVTHIQRDTGSGGGHGGGGHTYHSSGGTHSSGGRHF